MGYKYVYCWFLGVSYIASFKAEKEEKRNRKEKESVTLNTKFSSTQLVYNDVVKFIKKEINFLRNR